MKLTLPLLAAGLALGCTRSPGSPAPSAPAPSPTAAAPPPAPSGGRTLAADEQVQTASGARFTASAGWWLDARPGHIELRAPEGDLRWYHVELEAADRDAAAAAAWRRVAPGFALAVERADDLPPRDGWDAVSQIKYVTPALSGRTVLAVTRRLGAMWYVDLVDGTDAALDRRAAQLMIGLESLRAPGAELESFAGRAARQDAALESRLDAFVRRAMADARVPGAAIAIVHRGEVVLARGWGVRALGAPAAVTPDTRFMIGSVTKPLTSLLMARLVDTGALRWDTPVTQLLPDFALADPEITRALTLRHTVCACTGLPRSDAGLIFDGEATPEARVAAMRSARPTTKLGETFQYSNMMVAVGGYAAARAFDRTSRLGPAYDRAMRELVFRPLGMRATTLDPAEVARADHAAPHPRALDGSPVAQPLAAEAWTLPVAPAGAVWSTVRDLARVLQLELGDGRLDGVQLVSRDALLARRAPQVRIKADVSYGLALGLERYRGVDVVWHTGGTAGFSSMLWFLPEHQLGVVVLTNAGDAGAFNAAVRRRLFELWFDGRERAEADLALALATDRRERAALAARITDREPAWVAPLLGRWAAPGLGTIELRRERGRLVLDSGQWRVALAGAKTPDGAPELLSVDPPFAGFELVPQGEGASATLVGRATGQDSVVFSRVP